MLSSYASFFLGAVPRLVRRWVKTGWMPLWMWRLVLHLDDDDVWSTRAVQYTGTYILQTFTHIYGANRILCRTLYVTNTYKHIAAIGPCMELQHYSVDVNFDNNNIVCMCCVFCWEMLIMTIAGHKNQIVHTHIKTCLIDWFTNKLNDSRLAAVTNKYSQKLH